MGTSNNDNILVRWKRHFDNLSSPFTLRRTLDRVWVDFIDSTLSTFWDPGFFEMDFIEQVRVNQLHFIQSLVYKLDKASFYRALEVCFLIDYARSRNLEQYRKLESIKGLSEKVRDVLCELLVEYAFNEAGFPYEANAQRGAQILEGYCTIAGEKFLVECKNKYSMTAGRFEVICSALGTIATMTRADVPGKEFVGRLSLTGKAVAAHQLHKPLERLRQFMTGTGPPSLPQTIKEVGVEIDLLPGDAANWARFDNRTLLADLCFAMRNTYEVLPNGHTIFRMQLYHNSSAGRTAVSKRLLKTISDARKQHQQERCFGRVICIFNEFYNDLRPPLLVNSEDFVPDVERYLEKRATNDIVVLVDRRFNLGIPQIQYIVIGNPALRVFKDQLRLRLDFSIYNR